MKFQFYRGKRPFKNTFLACLFLQLFIQNVSAQTKLDTVKTGKANDPMTIITGKGNDKMDVKPTKPNDGMSLFSDTAFIRKNIADNKMEIALAKIGQQRGTTAEVKKAAAVMIADHTTILTDLEKLATRTFGLMTTFKGNMAMQSTNFPKGKDFDKFWAGQMLTMHDEKIAELETFIGLTKNATLKAVVMKAIPRLKAHREMLLKIPGAKESAGSSQII